MRITAVLLALFAFNVFADSNLTITPADDGTDLMWLSWIDMDDTGMVARYNGFNPEGMRTFIYCPDGVSSTITEDPSGGIHLMFSKRDTLFSLDPMGDMITENHVSFPDFAEWYRSGLLRRSINPEYGLLGRYLATYMSSGAEFFWSTREYTVSETGEISPGDSLILEDPWPYQGLNYNYILGLPMVYPVVNETGCPVMATTQLLPGSPMPPTPGSFRIATMCHNTTASPVYLTADTLTWSTSESPEPVLMASGSCSSNAIFLWSDSTETVYYSLHDCENGIVSTIPFPGQGPLCSQAAGMSANPNDPGLLLAWYDGSNILCRHYQEGWNDYAYVLAEDILTVIPGNIAVCSVEEGYWVAYLLAQYTYPFMIFVDRDDITSIEARNGSIEPVTVRTFPNPFAETLSVNLQGASNYFKAVLYDHSGRVVRRETYGESTVQWNTADLPAGFYLVRVTSGENVFTEKAVLVR